jgi:hypothetical protein
LCATAVSGFAVSGQAIGKPEASPTGKGITGGVLLGGEVVLLVEAALDLQPAWAYLLGGVAGGVGGGIGGYYLEKTGDPRANMLLLAGGMALIIPTTVAVLNATAYEPPKEYLEDKGPEGAEPPPPRAMVAPGLLGVTPRALTLNLPAVDVRDLYSPLELQRFPLRQGSEVRVQVVSWLF